MSGTYCPPGGPMPPCGSPPTGCPACMRCAPQTGRSGQGAVPPIFRAYGVPALAGSWAPFPLFCPAASASTSEAPVVGVGVGHLVRTTSVGPGGPIHSPGEKFSLGLPFAVAMRRNHRLSHRSARSAADRGWGSLPAANATRPLK